jgi:hypothetical protein
MTDLAVTPQPDTPLQHALALAACGLRVLPIRPGQKYPPMNSWQHAATCDPKIITNWFKGLYEGFGVGIAMGRQPDGRNLFALDIDRHDGAIDGWETFADLVGENAELPDTAQSLTGSGGMHLIFDGGNTVVTNGAASQVGPGLDIRGEGGQIVVAPTTHPNGRPYTWEDGYAPWEHEIAMAPDWLLELVAPPQDSAGDGNRPAVDLSAERTTASPSSPADHLRNNWDWYTELTKRGWQPGQRMSSNGDTYWTRPGKNPREGTSAVLHSGGPFVVFTTDATVAPMWRAGKITSNGAGVSLSPLAFVAAYDHGGDLSLASKALRDAYGTTTPTAPLTGLTAPTDTPQDAPGDDLRSMLLDWPTFWTVDRTEAEWLAEPIIARGRSHALFSPAGTGKSLLALWLAAAIATGRPIFGHTSEPRNVLYLDYEMTADDLAERLENMDYGPDTDLTCLHYALLPSLPGLDQADGGSAVLHLARLVNAELVVIDTFGRAVHGDENEADTVRNWYRWTGIHLKAEHRAFIRVDHAGKDLERGQRGTSGKNDDVDVVWQLTRDGETFTLKAKKRRMGWIPETVELERNEDTALRYALTAGGGYPAGTAAVAKQLDDLGVPIDAGYRTASKALKDAGHGTRNATIRAAQKYRRNALPPVDKVVDKSVEGEPRTSGLTPSTQVSPAPRGAPHPETEKDQVKGEPHQTGRTRAHPPGTDGGAPVSLDTGAPSANPENEEEDGLF